MRRKTEPKLDITWHLAYGIFLGGKQLIKDVIQLSNSKERLTATDSS